MSDKKHRDKEKERMKHKDGSADKYKDKHKEKKVNYHAHNSWKKAHVVVHVMLRFLGFIIMNHSAILSSVKSYTHVHGLQLFKPQTKCTTCSRLFASGVDKSVLSAGT